MSVCTLHLHCMYCCFIPKSIHSTFPRSFLLHLGCYPSLDARQLSDPLLQPHPKTSNLGQRQHPGLHPAHIRLLLHLVQRAPYELQANLRVSVTNTRRNLDPPTLALSSPGVPPHPRAAVSPLQSSGSSSSGHSPVS